MPGIENVYQDILNYTRIGFSHQFDKLTNDELKHILEYKWEELSLPLAMKTLKI